jgi:hypothetical protein
MKIAGKFPTDCQVRRLALVASAYQFDLNFAAIRFRHLRQHTIWTKRHDLRGRVSDQYRTLRRIASVEPGAINHDFATGDRVRRIYIDDFRDVTHKGRSSYETLRSMSIYG